MITNHEELEVLAAVIFEEIQQSFRDQGARPGLQLSLPFAQQPDVIRRAYRRAAAAANTHLINLSVNQSVQEKKS